MCPEFLKFGFRKACPSEVAGAIQGPVYYNGVIHHSGQLKLYYCEIDFA